MAIKKFDEYENVNEALGKEDIGGFDDFPEHVQRTLEIVGFGAKNDHQISEIDIRHGKLFVSYKLAVFVMDGHLLKRLGNIKHLEEVQFLQSRGVTFMFSSKY